MATLMFGLDEDDDTIFDRTFEFLETIKLQRTMFGIAIPIPGTALYERYQKENCLITDDFSKYDGMHVVFQTKRMAVERPRSSRQDIQRRYYGLGAIARRLLKTERSELIYSLFMNLTIRKRVMSGQRVYNTGVKRLN